MALMDQVVDQLRVPGPCFAYKEIKGDKLIILVNREGRVVHDMHRY